MTAQENFDFIIMSAAQAEKCSNFEQWGSDTFACFCGDCDECEDCEILNDEEEQEQ